MRSPKFWTMEKFEVARILSAVKGHYSRPLVKQSVGTQTGALPVPVSSQSIN